MKCKVTILLLLVFCNIISGKEGIQKQIEEEMIKLISTQGGWGFYEGQFASIIHLKEDAIPVLLEMFTQESYQFITPSIKENSNTKYIVRGLAGYALADFKPYINSNKSTVLSTLIKFCKQKRRTSNITKTLNIIGIGTLYHLGEKSFFNEQVLKLQTSADDRKKDFENSWTCFSLGLLYLRTHKKKLASHWIEEAIKRYPYSKYCYALSCIYASEKKINDALFYLEYAIALGYSDLEWINMDRDMDNLREKPRFKKIINKIGKTQKK